MSRYGDSRYPDRPASGPEPTEQDRYYDAASYLGADQFPPWTDDADDHEDEL